MTDRKCCYLEDGKPDGAPCQAPAEWEIFSDKLPLASVDACTKHVGALLDDSQESRVYPVDSP